MQKANIKIFNNSLKKILIILFISLFSLSPIRAFSSYNVPLSYYPGDEDFSKQGLNKNDYKYFYSHVASGQAVILYSSDPILNINGKGLPKSGKVVVFLGVAEHTSNGDILRNMKVEDFASSNDFSNTLVKYSTLDIDNLMYSNSTIKNLDGSDFFYVPPAKDATLEEPTQALMKMILLVVGLTICLVFLWIFLKKFVRALIVSLTF